MIPERADTGPTRQSPPKRLSASVKFIWLVGSIVLATYIGFAIYNYHQFPPTPLEQQPNYSAAGLKGEAFSGNDIYALALAQKVGAQLNKLRADRFTRLETTVGAPSQDHAIRVRCELRNGGALFMVQVPDLRKFDSEAQASLANYAWEAAGTAIASSNLRDNELKVALGMRGLILYERVLLGIYSPKNGGSGPVETVQGAGSEERIEGWLAAESELSRQSVK